MADAKIITYGEPFSATTDVIPDGQTVALDIESSDGKDYVQLDTSSEQVILGQATKITGPGGSSGMSIPATHTVLLLENGTGSSATKCQLDMNTDTSAGSSQVRFFTADTERASIIGETAGVTVKTEASTADITFSPNGTQRMRVQGEGYVSVGAAESQNNKVFEVNRSAGQAVYFDIQGNTSYLAIAGNATSVDQSLHIGSTQRDSLKVSKYGAAYVNYTLGSNSGWSANETNSARSVYLDDTNSDLIINYGVGNVGVITLAANIDKIKFFNLPTVGSAQSFTLRIKQDASTPREIDWSTVEFYGGTDSGSQLSGSKTLTWSGGVAHTMSTSTSQIDIVQFTAICDTVNTITIYGSVIGQNFS